MLPFDSYVQKSLGNRQLRSVAERQLYWSTYQKIAYQAPAPRRRSSVWMGVRRLPGALQRWWHECLQTDMQAGGEGAQLSPFISEKGKV